MIRPLYKAVEPFMDLKTGFGYQGVVMYDDVNDLVQCAICGVWKRSVGSHSIRVHGVNRDDYKMRFGLSLKTALCSKSVSNTQSRNIRRAIDDGRVKLQISKLKRTYKYRRRQRQSNKNIIQVANRSGLCELQMKARYEVVKKIVGREPKQLDVVRYDPALMGAIVRKFKTINAYRRLYGVAEKTMKDYRSYSDVDLIAVARKFKEQNKRCPRPIDFYKTSKDHPHFSTIYDRFGSWSNFLSTAGFS